MHIHWCHKWLILCSRGQTLSFHSPETLMSNLEVKCFLIRTILAGYVQIWPKIGRRRRLRDCGSQLLLEQFTKYGIYQLVFLLWGIARIKPQFFSKFSHILLIRFISLLLTPSLWPLQHFPLLWFSRWLDQPFWRRRSPMRMRERQKRENWKRRRMRHNWRRTMWKVLNEPSWSACSIGMLWLTGHPIYPEIRQIPTVLVRTRRSAYQEQI